jgi:hypothetical protein
VVLVRLPISYAFGTLARAGAHRAVASTLARVDGVDGETSPEARDLSVKLRYVLFAAAIEALAFALAKALADRGTEKVSRALIGKR